MSKELINLSNLQRFLLKLNEKFALKKAMKGISEDSEGNIIIGEEGLVPTPNENSKGKFLRSDGEWALPSETAVYDSMRIEEGVAGVSEVDKVLNAKNLKQIVNSDGFLTSLDSSKLTGVINIENLPQGALERILIVSSKEERLTLSDTEVQLGDVVKEADTGLMYYVINTEKLNSEEGYTQFTAGMASSVPWSGVTDKPLIPTKTSQLINNSGFAIDSNVVHKSGNETIAGTKTFSDKTISNKELHYKDTKYDWTNTSLNVWCDAGHVAWYDNTGNRRMHELVGAQNGVWRKACYINENQYFSVDSNRNISYEGTSLKWNGKNVALDENLVHRSGDEHIHGTKMFSGVIHRYTDLTTSGGAQVYRFDDTNANACGHIYNNVHWHDNAVYNRHGAYNAKSGKSMEIDIISNDSGVGMAYVSGTATKGNLETVTSAAGHTGIATMGWVNNPATSTNVVHRSGNETINGVKIFTDTIHKKNSTLDLQVNPSSDQFNSFLFTDKNNKVMCYLEHVQTTTGVNVLGLITRDKNNGSHGIQVTSEDNVIPLGNGVVNLGLSGAKWKNVYATTFNGNLKGNADSSTKASYLDNYSNVGGNKIYLDWDKQVENYVGLKVDNTSMGGLITTKSIGSQSVSSATYATKATQDSAGQQINKTYIKELSVSGRTITYKRGDNTTGTITTQDTNTTYSKLSQFTNDSGFITSSGSCNYATTAGNGIDSSGINYIKFKDGTQICWGSNKGGIVTFANAFTSTPCISFGYHIGSENVRVIHGQASYSSSTSFIMQVWDFKSNAWVTDRNVEWVAIGRWK